MNDQRDTEEHIFTKSSNMKSQRITKKNKINEIDLFSNEKIISTQIENQSNLLINIAVKKLITIEIIAKKMNKINIRHAEK